jgi:hypothetical protein
VIFNLARFIAMPHQLARPTLEDRRLSIEKTPMRNRTISNSPVLRQEHRPAEKPMKTRLVLLGLSLTLAWSAVAHAGVGISQLDQGMAGPRAKVLVLGTVHLSQQPKSFNPASLAPLLDRLAAYKPQIITIEALSGESCALMASEPSIYEPKDVATYCRSTRQAQIATGLDVNSAVAQVSIALRAWPANPTSAQRRHLAALFMAAGDDASALTQWLQLPQAERHTGDGLDNALIATLDKLMTDNNEDYQIAARLAARLGLPRVYPVDDHTGDNVTVPDDNAYGGAIEAAWNAASAQALPIRQREDALRKSGDMLALYRYINSPDYQRIAIRSDFGAALKDKSPQHFGQLYVAGWETRNLRMVANVRAAFREHPGARVLCIVGASHKPWFDKLLGLMQGVDVIDAEKVLNGSSD